MFQYSLTHQARQRHLRRGPRLSSLPVENERSYLRGSRYKRLNDIRDNYLAYFRGDPPKLSPDQAVGNLNMALRGRRPSRKYEASSERLHWQELAEISTGTSR